MFLRSPILRDEVDKHQIDLLREYMRDLQIVRAMFDRDKADPPIHRNQPPLAGALRCVLSLDSHLNSF